MRKTQTTLLIDIRGFAAASSLIVSGSPVVLPSFGKRRRQAWRGSGRTGFREVSRPGVVHGLAVGGLQ